MQLTKDDVKEVDICVNCGEEYHMTDLSDNCVNCGKGTTYTTKKFVDFSKFQQVVAFYEKYKDSRLDCMTDFPKTYEKFIGYTVRTYGKENAKSKYTDMEIYRNWLFNYCFVEGLK